ncbi:MAG: hypothetical protein HDR37_04505 [Treponema sp.]|nr:hypothetical protein [Treponema sp.]
MKAQTLIFTICVVSLFLSCSKKHSASEIEIAPSVPAETVSVQTKIPESSSKDVVFSEEDKIAIRNMKRHIRRLSANDLVESKPMGTYELYYGNTERVWTPVTSITNTDLEMNGKAAYAKFSWCLNAKKSNTLGCFNDNGITLIALEEEGKDDNILTLLFSNDQAKTWNTAYVEIAGEYLGGEKYPKHYPFCTDSNIGYLLLGGMEKVIVDVGYSGEKIPGARIFRTQDAGASWEEIGRISNTVNHYLFVQGSTFFWRTKKSLSLPFQKRRLHKLGGNQFSCGQ